MMLKIELLNLGWLNLNVVNAKQLTVTAYSDKA